MFLKKLQALFRAKGVSQSQMAQNVGITVAYFNKRLHYNRPKLEDLIKYAHFTGTTLAFVDKETNQIVVEFDMSDIEEEKE